MLCVQAQLLSAGTGLQPGGTATYDIWVWSTVTVSGASATASITGQAIGAPAFTLCPMPNLTTCTIGTMPASQAYQMIIKAPIGATAVAGEQVTLTLTIQADGLSPGVAAVVFVVGQATLTPVPTGQGVPPASQGTQLTPIVFPTIGGSTVAPANLDGLFPVITQSSGQASPAATRTGQKTIDAYPVASTLPLDPRLIGSQLGGLAVLAAALTMVLVRLSLRAPAPAARPAGPGKAPGT